MISGVGGIILCWPMFMKTGGGMAGPSNWSQSKNPGPLEESPDAPDSFGPLEESPDAPSSSLPSEGSNNDMAVSILATPGNDYAKGNDR